MYFVKEAYFLNLKIRHISQGNLPLNVEEYDFQMYLASGKFPFSGKIEVFHFPWHRVSMFRISLLKPLALLVTGCPRICKGKVRVRETVKTDVSFACRIFLLKGELHSLLDFTTVTNGNLLKLVYDRSHCISSLITLKRKLHCIA